MYGVGPALMAMWCKALPLTATQLASHATWQKK